MPHFLLIRHGQSQGDLEDRFEGRADFPLTPLGREQARAAARWLKVHWQPRRIISSPLRRAAQTASILAEHLALPVSFDPDLQEWSKGALDGMLRSEAERKYPLPKTPRGVDDPIQGGESARQVYRRAERFWTRLEREAAPQERVLIVTHGGVLTMLYRVFLGLPVEAEVWFPTGDAGMHLWEVRGPRRIVHWANRLPPQN